MENDLLISSRPNATIVSFQNSSVLDSAVIDAIGGSLLGLLEARKIPRLVLDFSEVRFLSSQALGVFLKLREAMEPIQGLIIIVGLRPELMRVFKISNLHKKFTFFETIEEALRGIDATPAGR